MKSVSRAFEARFTGVCDFCGIWYLEGEPIRFMGRGDDRETIHDECWQRISDASNEPKEFTFDPEEIL